MSAQPFRVRNAASVLTALLITLISTAPLISQTGGDMRIEAWEQQQAMTQSSLFANLPWQFIGPVNISGRVTDVAVTAPRGKTYTIYAAAASGGVWKTVNEGTTWEPVFEHAPSTSTGDVTIAPSDDRIVWVGTGEANIFRSSMAGTGVYKSTDAGETWRHMGLAGTHTIGRIIIHPENPDIVYTAASGHEWKNNPDRGIYKTTDGGETWQKIKYIDEKTGAIDLVMDPSDPNTLYAAFWQRIRKKWNDPRTEADYSGSGIYKTTDGGATWKAVNTGLPAPHHRGRIGIDICQAHPNVLYAFVDNYEIARKAEEGAADAYGRPRGDIIKGATVFRSNDKGETWQRVSEENRYMEQVGGTYGWVFGQIRVDPVNPDKVYIMGIQLHVSEDSGKTFRQLRGMHADHHALWIDPDNTDYLVNGQDGGMSISYDGGSTWKLFTHNLPAVQFYNVSMDMSEPFKVYGSIQDHFSYAGVVDLSNGRDNIRPVEFHSVPGGEGSRHAIDPTDPDIVYSEGFYGSITRSNLKTGERKNILPPMPEDAPALRGQWVAPFILSPHNPRILYHGMQYLFRSLDRGDTWERISPDLTYNDPAKLGDIRYQTLFAIAESPLKFGLIYAGTDDGRVHMTRNSGGEWTELTKKFPKRRWISCIEASRFAEGRVYLTQNGKRDEDFNAYIWRSDDYGRTWKSIAANIPCGPVNVIREDPVNPRVLYTGTDMGAYVSLNGGESWETLSGGFPSTFVHDLKIHPRDNIMVAATHGRGMWAMDVSHIQKLTPEYLEKSAVILDITPPRVPRSRWERPGPAQMHIFLKEDADISVSVTDSDGATVTETASRLAAGYHTITLEPREQESGRRPAFAAGDYTVSLKAGTALAEETMTAK